MKKRDLGWAWKGTDEFDAAGKWLKRQEKRSSKPKESKAQKKRRRLMHASGAVFYDSKPWKRLRLEVLTKYGRKCMKCDAVDVEMHVDHIVPRAWRPDLSLAFSNLQVLCKDCNLEKSAKHAEDYRAESIGRDSELEIVAAARQYI